MIGTAPAPDINDYDVIEYSTGIGLRTLANDMGIHRLRQLLNLRSRGNAGRILRRYSNFLPRDGGIDSAQLLERFRESIARQLAA